MEDVPCDACSSTTPNVDCDFCSPASSPPGGDTACDACGSCVPNPACDFCSDSAAAHNSNAFDTFERQSSMVMCDQCMGAGCEFCTVAAQDFVVLSPTEMDKRIAKAVMDVASLVAAPEEYAEPLLRSQSWNHDKAIATAFASPYSRPPANATPVCSQTMCPYCDNEPVPESELASFPCGHCMCLASLAAYAKSKMGAGAQALYTRCNAPCSDRACKHKACQCKQLIAASFMTRVLESKPLEMYKKLYRSSFVENRSAFRQCRAPNCDYVIERVAPAVTQATCLCGFTFCFGCGHDHHDPLPCDLASRFLGESVTDSASEASLKASTKPCPKCKTAYFRDGMCIEMTCSCNCKWCWMCGGEWHADLAKGDRSTEFMCAVYEADRKANGPLAAKEAEQKKAADFLSKYVLYKERFDSHRRAAMNILALITDLEKKDLQQSQRIRLELRTLVDAFRLLQWTEPLSYFLEASPEKTAFLKEFEQLSTAADDVYTALHINNYAQSVLQTSMQQLTARQKIVTSLLNHADNAKSGADKLHFGLAPIKAMMRSLRTMIDTNDLCNRCGYDAGGGDINWGCPACGHSNSAKFAHCQEADCRACRLHGVKECWAVGCAQAQHRDHD